MVDDFPDTKMPMPSSKQIGGFVLGATTGAGIGGPIGALIGGVAGAILLDSAIIVREKD